jgi:acyl-CoA hydrolase
MSAEEAVRLVSSGDRVFVHGGSAVPGLLLSALLGRSPELHDVELVHLHLNGPVAMASAAAAPNIRQRALFVDASTRDAVATGAATYVPAFLSDVPRLFSTRRLPLDVALAPCLSSRRARVLLTRRVGRLRAGGSAGGAAAHRPGQPSHASDPRRFLPSH